MQILQGTRELDNILGHRPASAPAVLLDTGSISNSGSATEDPQGASTSPEGEEIEINGNLDLYNHVYIRSSVPYSVNFLWRAGR